MKPVLVALDMQPPVKLAVVASCDIGVGGMPTDTNAASGLRHQRQYSAIGKEAL